MDGTNPLYWACGYQYPDSLLNCGAGKGEPCNWQPWPFAQPHPEFHTCRWEMAKGSSEGEGVEIKQEVVDEAFTKAMDEVI